MALTQISTAGVKDDAVTSGKIPADAVGSSEIAANAVGSSELADNAVDTAAIADDAVTAAKIADNAITGAMIQGGVVVNNKLASNAVATANIVDANVTTAKIADSNITTAKIASDAVTGAKIADDAVDNEHIANNAVRTLQIIDNAINDTKIADQAVTLAKLPHGTSSNDGKFLRANNGADPTFETVTGTTIQSNAEDRLITGSGTANQVNAEDSGFFSNGQLKILTDASSGSGIRLVGKSGNSGAEIDFYNNANNSLQGYIEFSDAGARFWNQTNTDITIRTNNTERLRVLAGGGLTFNGDTASTNALNDYETGSWTPAISGGSSTSHSEQYGRYTKIGRLVVVSARIQFSCSGTSGNSLSVGGLPFTSVSGTGENYTSGGISYCNLDLDANRFHPYINDGANRVYFYEMNSGAGVNISGSFSNRYLGFSAHYFT